MASRKKGIFATKSGENFGELGGILPKPPYFASRGLLTTRAAATPKGRGKPRQHLDKNGGHCSATWAPFLCALSTGYSSRKAP